MNFHSVNKSRGFSLIELLLAMAIGLIILGSVTQLFKSGMGASRVVSQRSEMQDNVRAAINMIAKDVTLAGAGIPSGGASLPYGNGNNGLSLFGKDTNLKTWVNNNTYPTGNFGTPAAPVDNYMYGLLPGPGNGMEKGGAVKIPATNQAADAITSIYVDYTFPLNQYTATFANKKGTGVNLTIPVPAPVPALPAFIDGPGGIQVGDLILLSSNGTSAIAEVTNVTALGMTFADLDPLNINQSGLTAGGGGNIYYSLCNGGDCTTSASPTIYRIYAVTYFVEVPAVAGQLPKLMRQVDAHPAQPVADNIISLKFTYDVCDGTIKTPNCAGISDVFGSGYTPNNIHKVDISVMGQSILSYGNQAQNMQLTTSVSTRDLTFKDRYQ